jgi:peptidoglycan/xylan/chitin deacetylase (PgdA/CDA1 family)
VADKCLALIFHRLTATSASDTDPAAAAATSAATSAAPDRFSVTRDTFCRLLDTVALNPSSYLITFDDGHESDYRIALDELLQRKLHATFFIVPKWVGNRPGYLNWQQIREISAAGMTIGSHTMSHLCLSEVSQQKALEELTLSRETIEKAINQEVSDLALPGGFASAHIEEMALACGYKRIYTSIPGIWNRQTMLIPRVCVYEQMTPRTLMNIANGKFSLYYQAELLKYRFRQTVGPQRYLSLYKKIKRFRQRKRQQ